MSPLSTAATEVMGTLGNGDWRAGSLTAFVRPIPDLQRLRPFLPPTHFKALSVDFSFWFCFVFQSFELVPVSLLLPLLGLRGCVWFILVQLTASTLAHTHSTEGLLKSCH